MTGPARSRGGPAYPLALAAPFAPAYPLALARPFALAYPLALALAAAGCEDGAPAAPDAGPADPECRAADPGEVRFDPEDSPCEKLSSYGFFADLPAQEPRAGVVPFAVNSPLFSDYARKDRFVWLPEGTEMDYRDDEAFAFPVGAVLIKTFWYPRDATDPGEGRELLETRLLAHRPEGWVGHVYQWNDAQTEAYKNRLGDVVAVSWTDEDGEARDLDYQIPDVNQCEGCHVYEDEMIPLAPRARHLNRDFDDERDPANQLAYLAEVGDLRGAPDDPRDAPRAPVWDDPDTGTTEERARAWLDVNCGHCHNPGGPGRTSGLDLRATQSEPYRYGVCKPPVSAGGGSGGLQYGIVPGEPDSSILVYRIESDAPDVQMPELLRAVPHAEGNELIRDWIAGMEGDCDGDEEASAAVAR